MGVEKNDNKEQKNQNLKQNLKQSLVVVAMSGGVDSSVAAYLLKRQGYDVIGITMQIWQNESKTESEDNGSCCGFSAVEDARRVANALEIPHYVLNFRDIFKEKVIDYFVNEYKQGLTPNPCIACNKYVKWEALLLKAKELGADYIATGHYAKIEQKNGRYSLKKADDQTKDQTYALYELTQDQLRHTLMPLWEFTKDEVRNMAESIGLEVANKPDSQEICFISDDNHGRFIEEYTNSTLPKGNFINEKGEIIGNHNGIHYYTIGQRKGLKKGFGERIYVKSIDAESNDIVLAANEALFSDTLTADNVNFIDTSVLDCAKKYYAKIRYGAKPSACTAYMNENHLICKFDLPQRAITKGQAVVLYDEHGYVVCGGRIVGN